jgi:hypothetical protein
MLLYVNSSPGSERMAGKTILMRYGIIYITYQIKTSFPRTAVARIGLHKSKGIQKPPNSNMESTLRILVAALKALSKCIICSLGKVNWA